MTYFHLQLGVHWNPFLTWNDFYIFAQQRLGFSLFNCGNLQLVNTWTSVAVIDISVLSIRQQRRGTCVR